MTTFEIFVAVWPMLAFFLTAFVAVIIWAFKIQRKTGRTCDTVAAHAAILDRDKLMEWARTDEKSKAELAQLRKDHDELKRNFQAHVLKLEDTVERIWKTVEKILVNQAAIGKGGG